MYLMYFRFGVVVLMVAVIIGLQYNSSKTNDTINKAIRIIQIQREQLLTQSYQLNMCEKSLSYTLPTVTCDFHANCHISQ